VTNTPTTPAGWYPDPEGGPRARWWDGTQWTTDYQQPYAEGQAAALTAPAGTPVYGPWIWLVVFLPYVSLPLLFTLDFGPMFDISTLDNEAAAMQAQMALLTSPQVVILTLVGWLTSAAAIVASYFDWKSLQAAGMPKPFHWAWSFIGLAGYPVYAIGRAVIAKRRTGHGSAVLWVAIGMIVLTIIVSLIWVASMVATMIEQMGPLGP
jgi:hypothetical protein